MVLEDKPTRTSGFHGFWLWRWVFGAIRAIAIVLSVAALTWALVSWIRPPKEAGRQTLEAADLMAKAEIRPLPSYPTESLQNGAQGVAVAQVSTTPMGAVDSLDVIQAPDVLTRRAMNDALRRWRFKRQDDPGLGRAVGLRGRVIVYFKIEGGRGIVVSGDQLGRATRTGSLLGEIK